MNHLLMPCQVGALRVGMAVELQRWEAYHKQQLDWEGSKITALKNELDDCRVELAIKDKGLQEAKQEVRALAAGRFGV